VDGDYFKPSITSNFCSCGDVVLFLFLIAIEPLTGVLPPSLLFSLPCNNSIDRMCYPLFAPDFPLLLFFAPLSPDFKTPLSSPVSSLEFCAFKILKGGTNFSPSLFSPFSMSPPQKLHLRVLHPLFLCVFQSECPRIDSDSPLLFLLSS